MRINSRNLFLALAIAGFTLASNPSWAGTMPMQQTTPGLGSAPQPQREQPAQRQLGQQSTKGQVESISGTLVKSGNQYILEASNGRAYKLSSVSNGKAYAGRSVTVTGKVDSSSHTIQVQSITPQ